MPGTNLNFGQKFFDTKLNTPLFILLTIGTYGAFFYYWLIMSVKRINQLRGSDVIPLWQPYTFCGLCAWSWILFNPQMWGLYGSSAEICTFIGFCVYAVGFIVLIVSAFLFREQLRIVLTEHDIHIKINPFFTFFLTYYYFYYLIRNLETIARRTQQSAVNSATPSEKPADVTSGASNSTSENK